MALRQSSLFSWSPASASASASASVDFSEYQHGLLTHDSTISESSILLVVTRNFSKLWRNSPHHSQLMLQVGLTDLEATLSISWPPLFSVFLFVGTSQDLLPLWATDRNLEVGDFYIHNSFLLIYLVFISLM